MRQSVCRSVDARRKSAAPCASSAQSRSACPWPARRPSSWTRAAESGPRDESRNPPARSPRLQSTTVCSYDDVDELALHVNDFADRLVDKPLNVFVRQGCGFDRSLIRGRRDEYPTTQLAVHLHHQLDLILAQGICCRLCHRCIE